MNSGPFDRGSNGNCQPPSPPSPLGADPYANFLSTLASNPVPTGETASFPDTLYKQGVRHDLSWTENHTANERRSYLKLQ